METMPEGLEWLEGGIRRFPSNPELDEAFFRLFRQEEQMSVEKKDGSGDGPGERLSEIVLGSERWFPEVGAFGVGLAMGVILRIW